MNIVGNLSTIPIPIFNTINNETLFQTLNSNLHGYTLFAPNDTAMNIAFAANPTLGTDQSALNNMLLNHVSLDLILFIVSNISVPTVIDHQRHDCLLDTS